MTKGIFDNSLKYHLTNAKNNEVTNLGALKMVLGTKNFGAYISYFIIFATLSKNKRIYC